MKWLILTANNRKIMQLQRKKFGGIGSRQKSDSFQERK